MNRRTLVALLLSLSLLLTWAPGPRAAAQDSAHPMPPAGLIGWYSGTYVQLNWDADPAASLAGYNVYRAVEPDGGWEKLTQEPFVFVSFVDSTAPAGAVVSYKVRAVAQDGAESADGAVVQVQTTPTDDQAPAQSEAAVQSYDKNNIINDQQLTDKDALSVSQIQSFLSGRGSVLANYSTGGKSAAQHIYDACQAHGINPRVVLVTLQKEKGLINSASGNPDNFAMGWNTRDTTTQNFADQIYYGTRQFKLYYNNLGGYSDADQVPWAVNQTRHVSDGYVSAAYTATAGLYIYTPWIGSASGSVGGNYLFWNLWYNTFNFGSTTTTTSSSATMTSGWYWPTGSSDFCGYYGFLRQVGSTYHLAQDMCAPVNAPFYSIGDGEVVLSSTSVGGYGPGGGAGGAVVVRYRAGDGSWFTALYGHMNNPHPLGHVGPGDVLGYANAYDPPHVHFGVHPGYDVGTDPWKGYTTSTTQTYGFVDPIPYLNAHPMSPYEGYLDRADCDYIGGWAWDRGLPNAPISVVIWDGTTYLDTVAADQFRQDLLDAGKGNGYHAFNYPTPASLKDGQPHSIRVTISGRSDIELNNTPKALPTNCVSNAPPITATTNAGSITTTTATVYGSVNPNGSSTNFWFEWGTSSTLASFNATPQLNIGAGNSALPVSFNLSGLAPSTTYYFRAAASNGNGVSRGQILNFITATAPADSLAPALSITSHSDGQTVDSANITLTGTASDAGQGDNGISSVTVNGVRASGDTAAGSGTANWNQSLSLNTGANLITVVAKDNSSNQNPTTKTLTINYQPGGGLPPDPINLSWQFKTSMPQGRWSPAAVVYNGKIHVIGGDYRLSHFRYDPTTDTWTSMAAPPGNGIEEGGAVVVGTKIYAIHNIFDEQMRIYDPATDSWTVGATMPTSTRRGPAVAAVGGKVYVIGGSDASLNPFASVQVYDPAANSWTTAASMPTARSFASVGVVNNKIYVIGGLGNGQILRAVEVYDPSTNIWTSLNPMPVGSYIAAFAVLNNKIYIMGGGNGSTAVNSVYEFDPVNGAWRTLPPLQTARYQTVAGTVNNKIYVLGGSDSNNGTLASVEQGTPVPAGPTVATTAAASVSSTGGTLGGTVNPNGVSTTAWFEWSTNSTLGGATSTAPQSLGAGTTSVNVQQVLTGLTPQTTYYYRVVASNSTGTARGAINSFTTQPGNISMTVSPSTPAFPDTPVEQSTDLAVTISNDAASVGQLTGKVAATTLPFSIVSGGGAFSLAPGQSRQVVIRFAPTLTGSYSLDLTITHNATNKVNALRVPLFGRGVAANAPPGVWQVVDTIPLSGTEYARHIAISGNRAYITRSGARMTVLDLINRAEVNTVSFTAYPNASANYVAIVGDRAYVTLSNLGSNGQLAVVDTNTLSVLGYIAVGVDPSGVLFYNNRLYVTNNVWWSNGDPATVVVVNPSTNSVEASIPVGINPSAIAVEPLGGKAYVTNSNSLSKSASVIDTSRNAVSKTIAVSDTPQGVAILGDRAYVSIGVNYPNGTLEVFSTASDLNIASIPIGRDAADVAANAGYVFVANQSSGNVSVIDAASSSVVATLGVGTLPTGVAVNTATNVVYVTNQTARTISVIRKLFPNFSVASGTSSLTVAQGASGASTASVNSTGGFNSTVNLGCTGLPAGVTCNFSPAALTPPAYNSATSQLTVNVAANVAPGTYSFFITGTSGAVTNTSSPVSLTVASPPTYSIAGRVADGSGNGIGGVVLNLSGAQSATTTTSATGNYSFTGLMGGSNYTVSPAGAGYNFTPPSQSFANLGANQTADFTATSNATARVNVALSVNGGVASASTTTSAAEGIGSFAPNSVINGDRKGLNWANDGGWRDGTEGAYPDWLQVDFNGAKAIDEIGVFTIQDNYANPVEPTETQTFSQWGVTAFDAQYWNGTQWVTVPGGSITGNNKVWQKLTFPAITTSKIRIQINGALAGRSRLAEVEAWGSVAARQNVALAANGGTTSASSTTSQSEAPGLDFASGSVINGDRKGLNWEHGGGWRDGTDTFPDWLQVTFVGAKLVDEIDVFTIQDAYTNPIEPTETLTFSQWGVTAFDVQYWNGTQWVTVPGGSITGNNKVWRKFTFPAVTTTQVRVLINNALAGRSRLVEVEAWGTPAQTARSNVAAATSGAIASASSTTLASEGIGTFPASATINGDRKGLNWANGGGWRDATEGAYPDWLQVDFNGTKQIDEVDVFTVQDAYDNPSEPTETMTFSSFGITAFDVQYWNGTQWATVPGGSITGNNKIWRKLTFTPVTTSKIRVLVNNSLAGRSRIVELEAWGGDPP